MTRSFEANMATVTDQEWLDAHLQLAETGVFPADELAYVWEPYDQGGVLPSGLTTVVNEQVLGDDA